MKDENITIDKKHRIVIHKEFRRNGWGYFVILQRKVFLFGWINERVINDMWVLVNGYSSFEEALEVANKTKNLFQDENEML